MKGSEAKPQTTAQDASRRTYRKALKRFMEWLLGKGISNPTREDILVYKAFLESQIRSLQRFSFD